MISVNVKTAVPGVWAAGLSVAATALAFAVFGAGAARAQEPALSAARFAALDSVYTMTVMLEDTPSAAVLGVARRVCEALDRNDRLLAVMRTACLTQLKSSAAGEAFASCQTPRGCRRATRRWRIVFSQILVDLRASNKVVVLELPPGPCRTELTASQILLRTITKLRDGLRLLERGLLTGKRAIIRRAERQIGAAALALARQATPQVSRDTFRRVCAPSPTAPCDPRRNRPPRGEPPDRCIKALAHKDVRRANLRATSGVYLSLDPPHFAGVVVRSGR